MVNGFNFYAHMRGREQKNYNDISHYYDIFNVLQAMFDYSGLPDTCPAEWLEGYLISNGTVGIGRIDGDIYCGIGGYCGDVHGYLPDQYTAAITGVGTIHGYVGRDIVVGWNNASRTPDYDIMRYASTMAEIDTSERLNVTFARLLRIPRVRNQRDKHAVDAAINAIINGRIEAVASTGDARDLLSDNPGMDYMDLADVRNADKLQYITHYRDNVYRRYLAKYGIPQRTGTKIAQQSIPEIHADDAISLVYPLQRLKYRRRMVDDINQLYGTHITVDLSAVWQNNYDKYINYVTDELNELHIVHASAGGANDGTITDDTSSADN